MTAPSFARIAVLHGGPWDGREVPLFGDTPEEASSVAPNVFATPHGSDFITYRLRSENPQEDGVRYDYDWSRTGLGETLEP